MAMLSFFDTLSLLLVFHFLSALSGGYGCSVAIRPSGTKVLLVNQSLNNVICQADGCNSTHLKFFNSVSGNPTDTGLCSTIDFLGNITCNATVTVRDNGTILICGVLRQSGNIYSKNELKLLVQGVLYQVVSVAVSQLSTVFLNISWSPVHAYEGLIVSYNISFNGTYNTQSTTWTKFNTRDRSSAQCDYINLSITPFIAASDQTLVGNTSKWKIIHYVPINHTMIMYENGTVSTCLLIDICICKEPVSSYVTLKNRTYVYSVTLPVTPINSCSGKASLMLPAPYMNTEVEVWLHYNNGLTIQMKSLLILNSNPLNIVFINGTPPSIQCIFTNEVIVMNEYSTGCVVYYTNMSQPVYAIRDNDESSVTINITGISSSGYYNVSVIPLPFPVQYLSVNISVKTSTMSYMTSIVLHTTVASTPTPTLGSIFLPKELIITSIETPILCLGWLCFAVLLVFVCRDKICCCGCNKKTEEYPVSNRNMERNMNQSNESAAQDNDFSYDEPTDAGDSNNASIQETALQEVQTSGQSSIVPSQELTQSNRWIQTDTVPTEESVEMMELKQLMPAGHLDTS